MNKSYRHPSKPSGFLVEEKFPELVGKWYMYRGGDISRFIEEIGGYIDLLVLDAMHIHPWETLHFLCTLPFMKKASSWVILHDTLTGACRYLFAPVVSDEKIYPAYSSCESPANIGAFKVSDATFKYVRNLFESLLITWESEVLPEDYADMKKIIEKYYTPEQYKFFCDVFKFQAGIKNRTWGKQSFITSLKLFIKAWQPGLFRRVRKLIKDWMHRHKKNGQPSNQDWPQISSLTLNSWMTDTP